MMTMSIPIPAGKKEVKFFFVRHNIQDGYVNEGGTVMIQETDSWFEFRKAICHKYSIDVHAYTIAKVNDNSFKKMFSIRGTIDQSNLFQGLLLLYENDPSVASIGF